MLNLYQSLVVLMKQMMMKPMKTDKQLMMMKNLLLLMMKDLLLLMMKRDTQLLVMETMIPSLVRIDLTGTLGVAGVTAAVWTTAGWPSTPWGRSGRPTATPGWTPTLVTSTSQVLMLV